MRPSKIAAECPRDGIVTFGPEDVLIDDENWVYRFDCPECCASIVKAMNVEIRDLLVKVGVSTIDQRVASEGVMLLRDSDIRKALKMK